MSPHHISDTAPPLLSTAHLAHDHLIGPEPPPYELPHAREWRNGIFNVIDHAMPLDRRQSGQYPAKMLRYNASDPAIDISDRVIHQILDWEGRLPSAIGYDQLIVVDAHRD